MSAPWDAKRLDEGAPIGIYLEFQGHPEAIKWLVSEAPHIDENA